MIGALGDHLWQSTLFAAGVSWLALALRRNSARVRYRLWLAASLKFVVPFAAVMALGNQLDWRTPLSITQPAVSIALDVVSQPFSSEAFSDSPVAASAVVSGASAWWLGSLLLGLWMAGAAAVAGVWLIRWRRVAHAVGQAVAVTAGREAEILRGLERRSEPGRAPLRLLVSPGVLEPGIFGIIRPVLLWPASIGARLSDEQVEAIVAHELAHVRRRDNLTAAIHMAVQSVFWFHPLVWWLGARLVDERERACDQEVIRLGTHPHTYAEGILKTVQFYLESPLTCVSGVTGSDLTQRIEDIMHKRAGLALNSWKKLLLATAGLATLAVPLLVDRVEAQSAASPAGETLMFESASVKPNRSGEMRVMMRNLPGGAYEATNVTARAIVQQALGVAEFQLLGGPDWLDTERYDILAKSPDGATQAQFAARYRALVEDRFKLKTHQETRELPVYALVLARPGGSVGPQMVVSKSDCSPEGMAAMRAQITAGAPAIAGAARGAMPLMMPEMPPLGQARPCTIMRNNGRISAGGSTVAEMARTLQQNTGRIVLDKTGLPGRYDFDLTFTMDPGLRGRGPGGGLPPAAPLENPRPIDPDALTIFTAVLEQLGLKLDATRGPIDVVVIDSIERATEN
jgi:uncharacterized protein (TIGR03435 family)